MIELINIALNIKKTRRNNKENKMLEVPMWRDNGSIKFHIVIAVCMKLWALLFQTICDHLQQFAGLPDRGLTTLQPDLRNFCLCIFYQKVNSVWSKCPYKNSCGAPNFSLNKFNLKKNNNKNISPLPVISVNVTL